jgi:hypothetical protein
VSAGRRGTIAGAWVASTVALVALTALSGVGVAGARPAAPSLESTIVHDVGPGYSVTFDGPAADAWFANAWVNPSAIDSVLTNSGVVAAYERAWQGQDEANVVQILLLQFSSAGASDAFTDAADRTLSSSAVVSSGTLPSVPGVRRTTYVTRAGFGQAVVIRTDKYVALLSSVSHLVADTAPITAADAEQVADAQHAAMARAPDESAAPRAKGGASVSDLTWAALAVAVMAGGLVTPLVLRRRREQPGAPVGRQRDDAV